MIMVDIRNDILETGVVDEAISILQGTKGIEKAFVIGESDRKEIIRLEIRDEDTSSTCFGKKDNAGMKEVLGSDILLSFVTNREYEWPENNLKIVHRGEVIGEDVGNADQLERFKMSGKHRVFGNIVIDRRKFSRIKGSISPPRVVIGARPCPQLEELSFVSEARIASPSKLTDRYIRSKMGFKNKGYIGSFLVGFNFGPGKFLCIRSEAEPVGDAMY